MEIFFMLVFNVAPNPPGRATNDSPNDAHFKDGFAQHTISEYSQNADDAARLMMGGVAVVRITRKLLPRMPLLAYDIAKVERHAMLCGEGFDEFEIGDTVPVLLIEDASGGLDGNITASFNDHSSPLGTFLFATGTGTRGKGQRSGGRFGVGSLVGSYASLVRAMFIHSQRRDGTTLASGRLALPKHDLNGEVYDGNARLGFEDENGVWGGIPYGPAADELASAFQMTRPDGKPGLSCAILYPNADLSYENLLVSILTVQVFQVATERVRFELVDEPAGLSVCLDKQGMQAFFASDEFETLAATQPKRVRIKLMEAREAFAFISTLGEPDVTVDVELDEDIDLKDIHKTSFATGKLVAMNRTLSAEHASKGIAQGSIWVFVKKLGGASLGFTVHARDGIASLSKAASPGIASLIVAADDRIADFLGDAENPSHTAWQMNNAVTRGWKKSSSRTVTRFSKAAAELISGLSQRDGETDLATLAEYFPKPGKLSLGEGGAGAEDDEADDGEPIVQGTGPQEVIEVACDRKTSRATITLSKAARDHVALVGPLNLVITGEYKKARKGSHALREANGFYHIERGAPGAYCENTDDGQVIFVPRAEPDFKVSIAIDMVRDVQFKYELIEAAAGSDETLEEAA